MANPTEVLVPDIGGFKDVSVIDVLVKDGQQIEKEAPLITIETEKAADRKSTRLNSSHVSQSRMPSSA